MTLTIQVDEQTVADLQAQASARGLALEMYLQELFEKSAKTEGASAVSPSDAVRDFDTALDELFAAEAEYVPPINVPDSREDIYDDHD